MIQMLLGLAAGQRGLRVELLIVNKLGRFAATLKRELPTIIIVAHYTRIVKPKRLLNKNKFLPAEPRRQQDASYSLLC